MSRMARSVLRWCADEAKKAGLKPQDYWGGFVIDEMKIQASCFTTNHSRLQINVSSQEGETTTSNNFAKWRRNGFKFGTRHK